MDPITLQAARAGAIVLVELVCDREFKDDCRANTGIVWKGKGDIQPYPAALWPKLAPHPDVWRLAPNQGDNAPVEQVRSESFEDERKRLGTAEAERVAAASNAKAAAQTALEAATLAEAEALAAQEKADKARLEAEQRQAELAGKGTDSQTVVVPELAFAESFDYASVSTPEAQAALTYEEMRDLAAKLDYGLNYRLGEKNLRAKFAELTADRIAQANEAVDTTGVDDTSGPAGASDGAPKE